MPNSRLMPNFRRITFAGSNRGKKLIQYRHRTLLSQRQFFIHATSLSNTLPNYIQNIRNAINTVFRQAFLLIQYSFNCKQYFFCSDREYQYFF